MRVVTRPRLLRALAWPLTLGLRPLPLAPRVSAADLRAAPPQRSRRGRASRGCGRRCSSGCVQRVLLRAREPCRRCRARGTRLRRGGAGRPGLLRGACAARGPRARRRGGGRRRRSRRWAGYDRVVVTAAGCGSAMKEYGELLGDRRGRTGSPRGVRDVTELLAELGPAPPRGAPARRVRVVYQDACHLRHGQGVVGAAAGAAARRSPGSSWSRSPTPACAAGRRASTTCSSREAARELGERKARCDPRRARPTCVATANPGCALQLAAALRRLGRARPADRPPGRAARLIRADPATAW